MFSMFFGSGNLVFPIKLGVELNSPLWPSLLGIIITGVIVPFTGLYGIILYKGYSGKYFNYIGKSASQLLIFLMLALLGPLGVIPRCITVATSGMKLVLPEVPEMVFSLFFSLTIYYMLASRIGVVQVLGKVLSPILIFGLLAIITAGLFDCPSIGNIVSPVSMVNRFTAGIFMGYHTMDLMAAFFFGVSISFYLEKKINDYSLDKKEALKVSILAPVIGGILLSFVYISFVYLGAKYSIDLASVAPERLIIHIANITLGGIAKPVAAVTIFLACFTTAIVLTQILYKYIEENLLHKKNKFALQGTIIVSFIVSLFGFRIISVYLAKILEVIYPGLIAISVMNIFTKRNIQAKKYIFWGIILFAILWHLYSLISSLQ